MGRSPAKGAQCSAPLKSGRRKQEREREAEQLRRTRVEMGARARRGQGMRSVCWWLPLAQQVAVQAVYLTLAGMCVRVLLHSLAF